MKKAFLSLFAVGLIGAASPLGAVAPAKVPEAVLASVRHYAEAIAPGTEPQYQKIDRNRTVCLNRGVDEPRDEEYLVMWNGDIGVNGGSHSTTTQIATVKKAFDVYYVESATSSPQAEIHLPNFGFIDKIVSHTATSMVLEGPELKDDDNSCCPTLRVRYTVQRNAKGNWVLQGKPKVIGKNPAK